MDLRFIFRTICDALLSDVVGVIAFVGILVGAWWLAAWKRSQN